MGGRSSYLPLIFAMKVLSAKRITGVEPRILLNKEELIYTATSWICVLKIPIWPKNSISIVITDSK